MDSWKGLFWPLVQMVKLVAKNKSYVNMCDDVCNIIKAMKKPIKATNL